MIYTFIPAPNAGQGAIEMGQTIKATLEIINIEKYTSMLLSNLLHIFLSCVIMNQLIGKKLSNKGKEQWIHGR